VTCGGLSGSISRILRSVKSRRQGKRADVAKVDDVLVISHIWWLLNTVSPPLWQVMFATDSSSTPLRTPPGRGNPMHAPSVWQTVDYRIVLSDSLHRKNAPHHCSLCLPILLYIYKARLPSVFYDHRLQANRILDHARHIHSGESPQ